MRSTSAGEPGANVSVGSTRAITAMRSSAIDLNLFVTGRGMSFRKFVRVKRCFARSKSIQ
jgi:hypothetical protein